MSFDFDKQNTNQNNDMWGFDFQNENYSDITPKEETDISTRQEFEFDDIGGKIKSRLQKGNRGSNTSLPRGKLTILIPIVIAIILCVVFRRQITEFLMTVLSWVIIILILYIILKIIFSPRRRR